MRRILFFLFIVAPMAARPHPAEGQYGRLPLVFEPNLGQTDRVVRFLARVEGGTLFLTDSEAVFRSRTGGSVRMRLAGASKPLVVRGLEPTGGASNYILQNNPAGWRTGIPHYRRVEYKSAYPGVDLVYYGNPQKLEFDLIVGPGANPAAIQLEYAGVRSLRVDRDGDLVVKAWNGSELRQKRPRAYQETEAGRVEVEAGYRLKGRRVGFELARYDRGKPLVIDPVLVYSTYLGGTGNDQANSIAVDIFGNAYITGQTDSASFPTTNPLQANNGGGVDVFITKINAAGSGRIYSTYLGGSGEDVGRGIAVDGSGNAYVTGHTKSANFPTANALQASSGGGVQDAFVAKINAAGSALVYCTYLGGSGDDTGRGIAVDGGGNAYITGDTSSTNFPTTNPIQLNNGGGVDVFVTKINAAGSARVYSTYLGGSLTDAGFGIAVDGSGNAYLTGFTASTNFPTTNPLQLNNAGANDVFVTKINAAGSARVYSTYLGGVGVDQGTAIAIDSSGNAYVTGLTNSTDFPTTNPIQSNNGGAFDGFVTKIDAAGAARVYSTYLGGGDFDQGNGIVVDGLGNAHVTGYTGSTDFPTTNPPQPNKGAGPDGFVTEVNAAGSAHVYSTYIGGNGADQGNGIAMDNFGNVYVTGYTSSTNFPTAHPLQSANGTGSSDAFVALISSSPTVTSISPAVSTGANQVYTFQFSDPDGYQDLGVLNVLINNFLDGRHACYLAYSRPLNVLYLVNDAGDALLPGLVLNGSGSVGNSQCSVNGSGSSAVGNGNTLTLTLNLSFNTGFGGNKVIYVAARDTVEHNSGWQTMGVHGVPPLPSAFPRPVSMSPSSGSAAQTTLTFTFQDAADATNLQTGWALINTAIDGRSACSIAYYRPGNQVYLYPDNGDGSQATNMVLTGTNTLANSQCMISSQGSSVSVNGAQLIVNLNITFKPAFSGPKGVWMAVQTMGGAQTSPWEAMAAWQVPGIP